MIQGSQVSAPDGDDTTTTLWDIVSLLGIVILKSWVSLYSISLLMKDFVLSRKLDKVYVRNRSIYFLIVDLLFLILPQ